MELVYVWGGLAAIFALIALGRAVPWTVDALALIVGVPVFAGLAWVAAMLLWLPLRAWWRGGWWSNIVLAAFIVAVIGCIWPQTGIWDNPVGRWFFGSLTPAPVISERGRLRGATLGNALHRPRRLV